MPESRRRRHAKWIPTRNVVKISPFVAETSQTRSSTPDLHSDSARASKYVAYQANLVLQSLQTQKGQITWVPSNWFSTFRGVYPLVPYSSIYLCWRVKWHDLQCQHHWYSICTTLASCYLSLEHGIWLRYTHSRAPGAPVEHETLDVRSRISYFIAHCHVKYLAVGLAIFKLSIFQLIYFPSALRASYLTRGLRKSNSPISALRLMHNRSLTKEQSFSSYRIIMQTIYQNFLNCSWWLSVIEESGEF